MDLEGHILLCSPEVCTRQYKNVTGGIGARNLYVFNQFYSCMYMYKVKLRFLYIQNGNGSLIVIIFYDELTL